MILEVENAHGSIIYLKLCVTRSRYLPCSLPQVNIEDQIPPVLSTGGSHKLQD